MQETVVLSTRRFTDELLDKVQAVSPRLVVKQRICRNVEGVEQSPEESAEVLYTSLSAHEAEQSLEAKMGADEFGGQSRRLLRKSSGDILFKAGHYAIIYV